MSTTPPITVSTDPDQLDVDRILHFLRDLSYWGKTETRERVERALRNSCAFGAFSGGLQVGYARVITDYVTFGYISDVFVDPDYRGHGVGKALIAAIHAHPELQGFRGWLLKTEDAHGLYEQFGWAVYPDPANLMGFTPSIQTLNTPQ